MPSSTCGLSMIIGASAIPLALSFALFDDDELDDDEDDDDDDEEEEDDDELEEESLSLDELSSRRNASSSADVYRGIELSLV